MDKRNTSLSIYVLATALLVVGIYFTFQWSSVRNRELEIREYEQSQTQESEQKLQECIDAARDGYNNNLQELIGKGEPIRQSIVDTMLNIEKDSTNLCIKQYK